MADFAKVEVRGLRELAAAFRKMDAQLPKQMKAQMLVVAQDVAGVIQQRMPHVTGAAQVSVKPRASARGAGIAWGGSAAPYMPWLDFGGRVGRNRSISRPFLPEGRYVYPGIAGARPDIEQGLDTAIRIVAKQAGFETRGGL